MRNFLVSFAVLSAVLFAHVAQAQLTIIQPAGAELRHRLHYLPDTMPAPFPGDTSRRAGWVNFWMFNDGYFVRADTSKHQVASSVSGSSTGGTTVMSKRRGKYTTQPEPNTSKRAITLGGGTPVSPDAVILGERESVLAVNWNAARQGDTVYVALAVKNRDQKTPRSGYLRLRFPFDVFSFAGRAFPYNEGKFTNEVVYSAIAADSLPVGTVYQWRINNLAGSDFDQSIFTSLLVKSNVRDSSRHLILLDVEWDKPAGGNKGSVFLKDNGEPGVPNPNYFNPDLSQAVAINQARDPNGISVAPTQLPPASTAPAHDLSYKVEVENVGNDLVKNLRVTVFLDPRIDGTGAEPVMNFPNGGAKSPNQSDTPNKLIWDFTNVNLSPAEGPTSSDAAAAFRRGSFTFKAKTKAGIRLNNGDEIPAKALIQMRNMNNVIDDQVMTAPAIIRVQYPERLKFGSVWGLKAQLGRGDSTKIRGGLALTYRVPLVNPRGNSVGNEFLYQLPRIFWQFELGLGRSAFDRPGDAYLYETQHIQVTPVQVRLFSKKLLHISSFFFYWGGSAGYTTNFITKGTINGITQTLPSAFGKRLEHELAASLEISTRIGVPSFTLGAGYKYRQNQVTGSRVTYGYPFISLQADIVRYRKRMLQFWTTTHHW